MRRLLGWLLAGLLVLTAAAAAQEPLPVPALEARVTDLTGTLSADQAAALESRLTQFEQQKGSQFVILIVPTTQPEPIEAYSIRVAEAWKIGRKGVDDGLILLVAKDDRSLRLEVGYGFEGALPDAVANRIIEDVIVPRFREGDFYGGLQAGVTAVESVVAGEPLPPPRRESRGREGGLEELLVMGIIAVTVFGGILRAMFGRLFGSLAAGGLVGAIAWGISGSLLVAIGAAIVVLIFVLLGGGGRGGYYGGFPGGRHGGWGGGGGGGFSGGGGGFGGGGASGRW